MAEETNIMEEPVQEAEELLEWVHDQAEDPSYLGGFKILPSCTCPNCGYHTNKEKKVCPHCGRQFRQ
ncbi:MAG: hypothetical protein K6E41_09040 [Solobacterium sp.]|jgi:rubrerythrin|nr:hypothetical protein [Solobacterium sp.]